MPVPCFRSREKREYRMRQKERPAILRRGPVHIDHGTSGPFSVFVPITVFHSECDFRIMCHHSQDRRNPHPENSPGSSGSDGSGDSGDISGSQGPGQGGAEGLESAEKETGILCFSYLKIFQKGSKSVEELTIEIVLTGNVLA